MKIGVQHFRGIVSFEGFAITLCFAVLIGSHQDMRRADR